MFNYQHNVIKRRFLRAPQVSGRVVDELAEFKRIAPAARRARHRYIAIVIMLQLAGRVVYIVPDVDLLGEVVAVGKGDPYRENAVFVE